MHGCGCDGGDRNRMRLVTTKQREREREREHINVCDTVYFTAHFLESCTFYVVMFVVFILCVCCALSNCGSIIHDVFILFICLSVMCATL